MAKKPAPKKAEKPETIVHKHSGINAGEGEVKPVEPAGDLNMDPRKPYPTGGEDA